MFATRITLLLIVAVIGVAVWTVAPSQSAGSEARYVVQPGDTLWEIATTRYAGDPREAIWRIKERNGLRTSALTPGEVLALP